MFKEKILKTELAKGQIGIFYLGQESILIKSKDKYLLFDAYLSDYVDKNCCSATTTWKRVYDAPIAASELDFVDYVFCSHSHYDHADPETLSALAKVNTKAKYIIPASFTDKIVSYGVNEKDIIAAEAGEKIALDGGIEVLPLPAAHEELKKDAQGRYECMSFKVSFGDISVYHAGDCCIYDGLEASLGHVDVMFLPVNGRSYYKRYVQNIIGNMTAFEAAQLSVNVGAELLVPMHIDLYEVNGITNAAFVDAVDTVTRDLCFHIFRPGEKYIYSKNSLAV